jgi:hypothetical protein
MERPRVSKLVHILPLLHLCTCVIIAATHLVAAWGYMFWVDAPASVFILALAYNHIPPLILFGTIGTLWWYLISYTIHFGWIRISALRNRRMQATAANSVGDHPTR